MDKFHLLTVYVAVAENQGFAAAARQLNMSPPAVTRAITNLENSLGVKLLQRTTRYVRTTDAGMRYLEDARRVLAALDMADNTAAGINASPQGLLTVTAPVIFGRLFVMPTIVDYLQRFADTQVNANFLDRTVNLLEEGIDIAVRIGELADSSMRALKVGQVSWVCCASPSYLAKHSIPTTAADLSQHCLIGSNAGSHGVNWHFPNQESLRNKLKPRLVVTSNDSALEAAIQGLGITRLLSYQVAAPIEQGLLVPLVTKEQPPALPVHILHREGRFSSAKVRSFVDLLAQALKSNSAVNANEGT